MTKIDLRPIIESTTKSANQSQEEIFQNDILRPILKLQHELIHAFFKAHINSKKIKFDTLTVIKKEEVLDTLFTKDNNFKVELRGLIIGLLTIDEFATYSALKKELNKRIYAMAKQRISSNYDDLKMEM